MPAYARAIVGGVMYGPALLGHDADNPAQPSQSDSAPFVPRSLVIDQAAYDWEGDDANDGTPLLAAGLARAPAGAISNRGGHSKCV